MAKYIHDEVIRAWLAGKPVQQLTHIKDWVDLPPPEQASVVPSFSIHSPYRIKPSMIRFGMFRKGDTEYFEVAHTPEMALEMANLRVFVRWITDWIEL